MKRVLLDTNGILRLLLNDVPTQKKTVEELLQKAKDKKISILVPEIVIFELEFALRKYYFAPKDKVIEKLETITAISFIETEGKQIFTTALGFYSNQNISFVDCFLLSKSQIEGYELFTFDKKLKPKS